MTGTIGVVTPTRRTTTAAVVLAVVFAVLALVVAVGPRWLATAVDGRVADAVRSGLAGHTTLLDVVRVLTWLGAPLVVDVAVLVGAALLWRRHRPVAAVALVATGLLSLVVRWLVKVGVDRPRPPMTFSHATGAAFPSGHTAGAAFLGVAAVVLVRRAWVAASATAYVVVVGASRVLLDVHWLSDVVGGVLLGAAFALLLPWASARVGERWPRISGATLPDR